MANMTVENKAFKLPIAVESNGQIVKVLNTENTYIDKNIEVTVTTPDAKFEVKDAGEVTAAVSFVGDTYLTETETPYAVTIKADAEVSDVTVGVETAGFAAASDTVTVEGSAATTDSKTLYIKEGTLAGTGTASAESSTVSLTKVGAQPENGFYIKASAAGGTSVATAGWVDPEHTTAVSVNGDSYYTVKAASLANAKASEEETYTTVAGPVLVSGSGLYIKEGYIGNTYVPLANLVPDEASVVAADNALIYKTVSVYDKDGTLIAGSMDDATLGEISAVGSAEINSVTVSENEGAFKVIGTANVTGTSNVAIATTGYAVKDILAQNGTVTGTASVEAPLAKIGLNVAVANDNLKVTPVIEKNDATTAKTGDITTDEPEGYYVAVDAAAIAASTTVTPGVATAGYGTDEVHSATGATVTAGSAASGVYYIPMTAGSHILVANSTVNVQNAAATIATTVTASDDDVETTGILNTAPATGKYLVINADATTTAGTVNGTATCTSVEGYIAAGQESKNYSSTVNCTVTPAAAKYIKVYDGSIL